MKPFFFCLFTFCCLLNADAQQGCYEKQLSDGDKFQEQCNIEKAILNWQSALDYCTLTNSQIETLNNRIKKAKCKSDPPPPPISDDMVLVKGGTFTMGDVMNDNEYDSEKPTHLVTLNSFYIGKYEVSQAEWVSVMGSNPSYFKGDNLPVENVSWDDIQGNYSKEILLNDKKNNMKTANQLIEPIADPENLRLAFWKASKGKRHSADVLAYQKDLDTNLGELRAQILRGSVEVGNYRYFKIYEPKERQICASAFKEQVLHHALMNICHPYFEKQLIFDSYASRKGKGTYAAVERAQYYAYQNRFFLKLDVRKFFDSVPHDVLKAQLARVFEDKKLLSIFNQIIDSYEAQPNRGLPIGNLTSQYFANQFLSPLDHFLKDYKVLCALYGRYGFVA